MKSTIAAVNDRTSELKEIIDEHYVNHLQVGKFFFIPAIEAVPKWNYTACIGDYPVIPFDKRIDIPEELKDPKYRNQIIYLYGLGCPLGYGSSTEFFHSPSTEAGLIALQELDLKGKTVLDAGCRYGEHTILPAKMGAHVIGVGSSIETVQKNARLNNVSRRVSLIKGDLCDPDTIDELVNFKKEISVIITNGGPIEHLAQNIKSATTFITCEPSEAYILKEAGYSSFKEIHYSDATAIIAKR